MRLADAKAEEHEAADWVAACNRMPLRFAPGAIFPFFFTILLETRHCCRGHTSHRTIRCLRGAIEEIATPTARSTVTDGSEAIKFVFLLGNATQPVILGIYPPEHFSSC
jgi:hypothetical protein